jgi:hypothetical protein
MTWPFVRFLVAIVLMGSLAPCSSYAQSDKIGALNKRSIELSRKGNYAKAAVLSKRALKLAERKYGRNHPHVATMLNNRKRPAGRTPGWSLASQASQIRKNAYTRYTMPMDYTLIKCSRCLSLPMR